MKLMKISLGIFLASLMLAGCSSSGKKGEGADAANAGAGTSGYSTGAGSKVSGGGAGAGGGGRYAAGDLDNPQSPLYKKVIYFQYDSSEVMPEYVAVIAAHAEFLAANPGQHVTLEGHADERGSREYNVALGEGRAKSVANMLKLQGVSDAQIQVVSYGEEKPACMGHDEACWHENRRVEFAYPGH